MSCACVGRGLEDRDRIGELGESEEVDDFHNQEASLRGGSSLVINSPLMEWCDVESRSGRCFLQRSICC